MRFFLPELYAELNSPDEDVADAAETKIEQAGESYDRHWDKIRSQLPPRVVEFHETEDMHDADVLAPAQWLGRAALADAGDIIVVAQRQNVPCVEAQNTLVLLRYKKLENPRVIIPVYSKAFHCGEPLWLYDEFDVEGAERFSHSILISDGRVCTIFFQEFDYHIAKIVEPQLRCTLTGATRAAS